MAPSIIPKRWAMFPGGFGKAREIDWKPATTDRERDRLRAAQIQHKWSYRLNVYRKAKKLTLDGLGAELHMTDQRIGALLRGDSPADLTDLAGADRLVPTKQS